MGEAYIIRGKLASLDEATDVSADEFDGFDVLFEELRRDVRHEVPHRVDLLQATLVQRLPHHLYPRSRSQGHTCATEDLTPRPDGSLTGHTAHRTTLPHEAGATIVTHHTSDMPHTKQNEYMHTREDYAYITCMKLWVQHMRKSAPR